MSGDIHTLSNIRVATGIVFLIWYIVVLVVAYRGFFEIISKFSRTKKFKVKNETLEGVSIIRPIKGIDPELGSCLESSFQQNYPRELLQILFCVDDPCDESIPIIEKLIAKYPDVNASILVSQGYNPETKRSVEHFGPNPKVNNLSKGFLNAQHDILWIMDSNVWASPNILRNSIKALNEDTNNGKANTSLRKIKLVHHAPLALSINSNADSNSDLEYALSPVNSNEHYRKRFLKKLGAKLDEMFLMTSHLKFYVSLNNFAVAPCVNGKSNIYRKSDLDLAVAKIPALHSPFFSSSSVLSDAKYYTSLGPGNSLKLFSRYIGEDNMIGICLWENLFSRTGMTGDFVIQPLSGSDNTVNDYITRRVRWLRVRKYMVLMATLVEPTTESIVCGLFGTYTISTLLWHTWFSWKLFALHFSIWVLTDYIQYYTFIYNIANADYQLNWLKESKLPPLTRSFPRWLYVWIMREALALPIWIMAMCGHEIDWRGKPFKIKKDLTAEEL